MSFKHSQIPVHEVELGAGILAFFTQRSGGVSPAPWDSLNLGANVQDHPRNVSANRNLVSKKLGRSVFFAHQIHSNTVLRLGLDTGRDTNAQELSCGQGDGLVTADPESGLGVLVADCVPILLADPVHKIIGAAHAGRAGLLNGVIARSVEAMAELGAQLQYTVAAIGPCICARCYEVPLQMARDFDHATGVPPSQTRWHTPGLDLRAAAHRQLVASGIQTITHVSVCTYEDDRQFSHRRDANDQHATGRSAGVIGMSGAP